MKNPDAIIISAYIPHTDGTRYIVNRDGELPSQAFRSEHGTYEGTLSAVTQEVIGTYGKIEERLPEKEKYRDHVVYRTNAIGDRVLISAQYDWKSID